MCLKDIPTGLSLRRYVVLVQDSRCLFYESVIPMIINSLRPAPRSDELTAVRQWPRCALVIKGQVCVII